MSRLMIALQLTHRPDDSAPFAGGRVVSQRQCPWCGRLGARVDDERDLRASWAQPHADGSDCVCRHIATRRIGMGRMRIPDHIQETAKTIVVLNMEVERESKLLEEDMAKIKQRQNRISELNSKLDEEEKMLLDQCRDWVRHKT